MDNVKRQIGYACPDTINGRITGRGVRAAILDTGAYPHPDFKGRVIGFADMQHGRCGLYDDSGHGTHVAGILAGDGKMSGGRYAGMAPGVELLIVKILDEKGEGNAMHILRGMEHVRKVNKKNKIALVNLSLGAGVGLDPVKENRITEAVEELCNCGITVVVSAGNYGLQSRKVSIPGTNEKVLTVGAYRRSGMGRYCSGTGRERICVWKPDIFAPREGIVSCGYEAVNGESCFQRKEFFPYIRKSGASMATPVVTGALALAKSKYPELEGEELKRYLLKRCGRSLRVEQLLA